MRRMQLGVSASMDVSAMFPKFLKNSSLFTKRFSGIKQSISLGGAPKYGITLCGYK